MTQAKKRTGNKVARKKPSVAKASRSRSRAQSEKPNGSAKAKMPANPNPGQTKQALVLEMLGRPDGASMNELIDATGWLPHTVRAALSGLRKKGHAIHCRKGEDRISIYQRVPRRAGD